MRLCWEKYFIIFTSLRNSDQLWKHSTAKRANRLVTEEVYLHWVWCWEKWDLVTFNSPNRYALWILAHCQDSLYIVDFSCMLLYIFMLQFWNILYCGWKKTSDNRRLIVERHDIRALRVKYLRAITAYREEGKTNCVRRWSEVKWNV